MTEHLNELGEPWLLTSVESGVACATLNRPEARNALALELREELKAFLVSLRTRSDVRVVLLQAAGKSFIAGGDIKVFGRGLEMSPEDRSADMKMRAAGAGGPSRANDNAIVTTAKRAERAFMNPPTLFRAAAAARLL